MRHLNLTIGPIEAKPKLTVWEMRERLRVALERHKAVHDEWKAAGWLEPHTDHRSDGLALAEKEIEGALMDLLTALGSDVSRPS